MSIDRFYPYRTCPDSLQLELDAPGLELPRGSDGALQIYDQDIAEVTLRAAVAMPGHVLPTVLAPEERNNPPVSVVLVCQSVEARRREARPLDGDGVYEITFTLRRSEWIGAVEFQAALVRTTARQGLPAGFGADRGCLLAWSEPRRVLFDEPPLPPGNFLEVVWVRFDEGDEWLRRHESHLFALETTGPRPRLLLNSGVPGAVSILAGTGTRGPAARIRDATYHLIVHQVWSSLLAAAMGHLAATAPSPEDEPDLDLLEPWQQGVLQGWAPFLFPEEEREGALKQLPASVRRQDTMDAVLLRRLPTAIQQRLSTFRGFEGLVQEFRPS